MRQVYAKRPRVPTETIYSSTNPTITSHQSHEHPPESHIIINRAHSVKIPTPDSVDETSLHLPILAPPPLPEEGISLPSRDFGLISPPDSSFETPVLEDHIFFNSENVIGFNSTIHNGPRSLETYTAWMDEEAMAAGLSLPADSVDPFALHYWPLPAEDINDERSPWTAFEDVVFTRHLDPTILQRGGSYIYPSEPTPGGIQISSDLKESFQRTPSYSSEPSMTDASLWQSKDGLVSEKNKGL